MTDEEDRGPAPLEERVQVGLGPQGVVLNVIEGETPAGTMLSPDEAFRIAGQLTASATIVIQAQYSAVARQRAEEIEFMAKTGGGKVWTPEKG